VCCVQEEPCHALEVFEICDRKCGADQIAWYNGLLPETRSSQLAVSHPYQVPSLVVVTPTLATLSDYTKRRQPARSTAQSWVQTSFWPAPLWVDQLDPKGQQQYSNCRVSSEKKRGQQYILHTLTKSHTVGKRHRQCTETLPIERMSARHLINSATLPCKMRISRSITTSQQTVCN